MVMPSGKRVVVTVEPPKDIRKTLEMCEHFLKGRCAYGDKCSKSHGGALGESPVPEAEPEPTEPLPPLITGARVRIHGLTGATQLNGLLGTAKEYDNVAGRWTIELIDGGQKKVKTENLKPQRPMQANPGLTKKEFCVHWSQYRCGYGDTCKFSHEGPGGSTKAQGADDVQNIPQFERTD